MNTSVTTLGIESLADDAVDAAELKVLLDDAGFLTGRERVFSARNAPLQRIQSRVLVFDSNAGAARYVGWLRSHAEELIGPTEELRSLPLPGSPFLLLSTPDCGCHNAAPIYLAAWSRGPVALTLKATGSGSRADVIEIVRAMDRMV
jgi:hypothetical protein